MGFTGRSAWLAVGAAFAVIAATNCTRPLAENQSHGGPLTDHVSFVDHLRADGYTVEIAGEARQPFLRADEGTLLRISGAKLGASAEVQSFQYRDEPAARADAEAIGPDGNPKTMQVNWVGPPHFFRKGRVIVLYVGNEPAVLELLNRLLGAQFAGRETAGA